MPDTIFWDTAAFVALGNRYDALHSQAVAVSISLELDHSVLVTTDAVLTEVGNTFRQARVRGIAQQLIDAYLSSISFGVAQLVHVDSALWERGWELFKARGDKDWSLTDCISFVVMQDHGITQAFTSDKHFEQAGFIRLLTPTR